MTQNNNKIQDDSQSIQVDVISRFLLPNNYLTKHEIKSHTGRIYWLSKHKKEFCKLYLDANYKDFDKHQLHFFMMKNRGGLKFNISGFPDWQYSESPIKLLFQNDL